MIEHSENYGLAIVGDSRRQFVKAIFDLVDPDAVFESFASNDESPYSKTDQLGARGVDESPGQTASLERNRWLLNGAFSVQPEDNSREGQIGWEGRVLSGEDCRFSEPCPYVELNVSAVEFLQAVTFRFSEKDFNGIPVDFRVEVYSGDNLVATKDVNENRSYLVVVDEMKVNYPTRLRLTVFRWSMPRRRVRVFHFLMGLYEEWDGTIIKGVDIYTEVTFSGLSLPYSTCTLEVYNEAHRFDPYAPNSIFQSIEDRQAITVELGLRLADGSTEWLPAGRYYQQSGGWSLKDLTVQWKLLDIIGMLTKRKFVVPSNLPTTLSGWIEAIMASLGVNFRELYIVDDDVQNVAMTASKEKVDGKTCGELLRFACMATNTWPRQDMTSGLLRVGKLQTLEGNRITLDNMAAYPTMEANDDIADITFTLDNGEVTFPGTNTDSEVSLSVNNPFVHNTDDARRAVISCLFEYGGKYFEAHHRGNPSSEAGDIQSVDTQFLSTISARLYKQQLKLENGMMRTVPSYLVQSPNDSTYANKTVLTGVGTFKAPEGAAKIKVTLIGGGSGGQGGGGGVTKSSGGGGFSHFDPDDTSGGTGGPGGLVYIVELDVNSDQSWDYNCGAGGAGGRGGSPGADGHMGEEGGETVFATLTSRNGRRYPNGLMDIQSGAIYAQQGANAGGSVSGLEGTGGTGGRHGENGVQVYYQEEGDIGYRSYTAKSPTAGTSGNAGKPGCIIVEW